MKEHEQNRKQRRLEAKMKRRKDLKSAPTVQDAVRRVIKEMQQNTNVQELVVSGKLDKYLG